MAERVNLVWFRRDLRVDDHPALAAAVRAGGPVVGVYVWSPREDGPWPPGSAAKVWLHHALLDLEKSLAKLGSRLVIRRGGTLEELLKLAQEVGGRKGRPSDAKRNVAIYWTRLYEPAALARDQALAKGLSEKGIATQTFNGSLLCEPWEIQTQQDKPYQVFTPFYHAVMKCASLSACQAPLSVPKRLEGLARWPKSLGVADLDLLPDHPWPRGILQAWTISAKAGRELLDQFQSGPIRRYATSRDDLALEDGTSRLSPYLHWGQLSIQRVWQSVCQPSRGAKNSAGKSAWLRQLIWREFSHHLLYHFPHTPAQPLRESFRHMKWRQDAKALAAWQQGRTGYPLVDAGMRQLWQTGWMHNRARLVAASFLCKHLRQPWLAGARWFWDTLVDADLANNTLGWQWTAGCGADAAPYFRVFNPSLQAQRFDPQGSYVARWIPPLAGLAPPWRHQPWLAPAETLRRAKISLGAAYPKPIIAHAQARADALNAYQQMRRLNTNSAAR
ncbi:MAG: deoxyribodipyrimidine photo-lyase [Phycisphaeraceae bacterium]|nr:deoxyribodipyrimidine photo-lyase [Phycisphaeraceae bacterium]